MKISLTKPLSLAALGFALAACGGGGGSSESRAVAGQNTVVVATVAADYSGSNIQLVEIDNGSYTALPGVIGEGSDQSDATAVRFGEHFYRLGRFNIDELSKYSFDAPSTPIYQYSTLDNPEDKTGNPYTVAFVNEQKAYVIQYGENEVLIVNPSAQTEDAFITGRMDLSAYADADGSAEAADGIIVDGKLFVVMQRLVNYSPAEEGVNAYIAVFDISSNSEIDTNPNDDPSNLKGIELETRNPNKFVYNKNTGLYLQSTGDAFYSYAGRDPGYTGGISKIDLSDYSVRMMLDDGEAGNAPYGFMYNLEIVDAQTVYFVGYQSYGNYNLYRLNPSTGAVVAVEGYSNMNISNIAADAEGNLWIGISDVSQPRIELFDGETTVETIGLLQNPGAILFAK